MKTPTLILAAFLTFASAGASADRYNDRDRGYDSYTQRVRAERNSRRCSNCGTVQRIENDYREGSSGGGAVLGALVGAALGNQVGSGDGRKAATVAGAVAGGVAGNRIERNRNERGEYELEIRMDNGRRITVEQRDLNGIREGDRVVVRNGRARLM
jgi:outer membrane lipoprotein SlyB